MSNTPIEPTPSLRRWLAPRLLAWYRVNRRDLPWRADRDPYRIWVSEVMLQQTQVSTVIAYFGRFLDRFPTLADLAAAEQQEVLRLWEGLGYYRRARDLHRAAALVVERHDGQIPADVDALADLPGMGKYTRNAVASQAFDLRLPIVEANSQRVLSRLLGYEEDPRQGPARKRLWRAAEVLLPQRDVGEFNQALMELGALVCTPTAPACDRCPVAMRCSARMQGRQEEIPARSVRPAPTLVQEAAVVIWREGKVLLARRRANTTRWANLWEFPHGELAEGESAADAALRLARDLVGIEAKDLTELTTLQHSVTRFRITLCCFESAHAHGEFSAGESAGEYAEGAWVEPSELTKFPVSAPQRRLAKVVAGSRQGRLFL